MKNLSPVMMRRLLYLLTSLVGYAAASGSCVQTEESASTFYTELCSVASSPGQCDDLADKGCVWLGDEGAGNTARAPGVGQFQYGYNMWSGTPPPTNRRAKFMKLSYKANDVTSGSYTWAYPSELHTPIVAPSCLQDTQSSETYSLGSRSSLEAEKRSSTFSFDRSFNVGLALPAGPQISTTLELGLGFSNSDEHNYASTKKTEGYEYAFTVTQKTQLYQKGLTMQPLDNAIFMDDLIVDLKTVASGGHEQVYTFARKWGTHMLQRAQFGTECSSTVYMTGGSDAEGYKLFQERTSSNRFSFLGFKTGSSKEKQELNEDHKEEGFKYYKTRYHCAGLQMDAPCNEWNLSKSVDTDQLSPQMVKWQVQSFWEGLPQRLFDDNGIDRAVVREKFESFVNELGNTMIRCGKASCGHSAVKFDSCTNFCGIHHQAYSPAYFPGFDKMIQAGTCPMGLFQTSCDDCDTAKISMLLTPRNERFDRWDVTACDHASQCKDMKLNASEAPQCFLKYPVSKPNIEGSYNLAVNEFDREHTAECGKGGLLTGLNMSFHDNKKEDRKYEWTCGNTVTKFADIGYASSPWVSQAVGTNPWDGKYTWQACPTCFLHKVHSIHNGIKGDRQFTFYQTSSRYWKRGDCRDFTVYLWDYDMQLGAGTGDCPENYALWAVQSEHDNKREDRLMSFRCCEVKLTPAGRVLMSEQVAERVVTPVDVIGAGNHDWWTGRRLAERLADGSV